MIDPDDILIHQARANRWLLRATCAAILILALVNADYILERI